jgi:hypothetical protein
MQIIENIAQLDADLDHPIRGDVFRMEHKGVQRLALDIFLNHVKKCIVFIDVVNKGDSWMIQILEKIRLVERGILQGERRFSCICFGDAFDGTINPQFQMFGEIHGGKTAPSEDGQNPVFAQQNLFFYASSAPFMA